MDVAPVQTGDRAGSSTAGAAPELHRVRLVSVILPAFNEVGNIGRCLTSTSKVFEAANIPLELVLVDDGSTDGTVEVARKTQVDYGQLCIISHGINRGKTATIKTGLAASKGDTVCIMDADLQYDSNDLVKLVLLIDRGFDAANGWRKTRNDGWGKTLPSRFFNWLMRQAFHSDIHDFNSGIKAFRRAVLENIRLEGDAHRFLLPLVKESGGGIAEIEVHHSPRTHGMSKFGPIRMLTGTVDLIGFKAKTTFGWTAVTPVSRFWRVFRYTIWQRVRNLGPTTRGEEARKTASAES
jgi:glycosyltransferase involved in cell wall biosynthesis